MIELDYKPSISFPAPLDIPKIDRAKMAQLVVETEHCSRVLSQVLEIVRDRDVLPFTIASRKDTQVQIIEMELRAPAHKLELVILEDIQRLPNVRGAHFLYPCDPASLPAMSAKA